MLFVSRGGVAEHVSGGVWRLLSLSNTGYGGREKEAVKKDRQKKRLKVLQAHRRRKGEVLEDR